MDLKIVEVLTWVTAHACDLKHAHEVAKHFSMGYHTLRKLFKEETGTSLSRYIRIKKFEWVRNAVKRGNRTAKDIAFSIGLKSANVLSKAFKRETGLTLREFSKKESLFP